MSDHGTVKQLQKKHPLGGSAAAVANAINEEVHSFENYPPALQIARYQTNAPGVSTESDATPVIRT
jgi:hypothetical protein